MKVVNSKPCLTSGGSFKGALVVRNVYSYGNIIAPIKALTAITKQAFQFSIIRSTLYYCISRSHTLNRTLCSNYISSLMNKYRIIGLGLLIFGIIIEVIIFALTINSCITRTRGFPFSEPFSMEDCYIIFQSVYITTLGRYPDIMIVVGIVMSVTGFILRSRGTSKNWH